MGGFGSGRQGGSSCTTDMRALDVRAVQRLGMLTPGAAGVLKWSRNGAPCGAIRIEAGVCGVTLDYRRASLDADDWEAMRYPVLLTWTPCNFGGRRTWWRCPAAGCGRRVAVLYGGRVFACRQCHQLAYRCQREADDDRATRRADKLRDRLGWPGGILHGNGGKPKGMHWRTFERLQAECDAHTARALGGLVRLVARMGRVDVAIDHIPGLRGRLDNLPTA